MRRYFFSLMMILVVATAQAQPTVMLPSTEPVEADSVDVARSEEKHFWRAGATMIGLNAGVWAFDRYVKKADYAYISPTTIKDNFKHGFVWDNDELATNMFAHPYNGGLYFNIGRANGYNFWQSGLFALSGSALWELFMENEYPSYNDIIATPIGGLALGEVTYRMSDMMLDDRTTGIQRIGHEAAAFIISPMRGLTRIINGDAWRRRETPGRTFGTPRFAIEFSAGVRALEFKSPFFDHGLGFTTELNMEYGDKYEVHGSKPYDYFTFRADFNVHSSQPFLDQLNIMGRLYGTDLIDAPNCNMTFGVYQHYDYYDSDTISAVSPKVPYRLGVPASVGAGLMYRDAKPGRATFEAYAHANAVILGGVLSDHYLVDCRDYNLGSGFAFKGGVTLNLWNGRLAATALCEYFRLFTIKGYADGTDLSKTNPHSLNAQGDPSVARFIVAEGRVDVRLYKHLYLSGAFSLYSRSTHYTNGLPHVDSSTTSTRLMLTYKF